MFAGYIHLLFAERNENAGSSHLVVDVMFDEVSELWDLHHSLSLSLSLEAVNGCNY